MWCLLQETIILIHRPCWARARMGFWEILDLGLNCIPIILDVSPWESYETFLSFSFRRGDNILPVEQTFANIQNDGAGRSTVGKRKVNL